MRRACAAERRIEKLRLLGRLADEVLTPERADRVLELIGDELLLLGIHPSLSEGVDPSATVH